MKDELPQKLDDKELHQALHQVDRQGTAQGDVQDGHLRSASYCGAQISMRSA